MASMKTWAVLAMCSMAAMAGCQSSGRVEPSEGITVDLDSASVEVQAWACLDVGWLEQVACSPGTREHESLVVIKARPSEVHAALLMAGFVPGAPGRWTYENDTVNVTPPTGDLLAISVRYEGAGGEVIEEPIRRWIRDHLGREDFPDEPWVFGGSHWAPNPSWMEPGEHYVADMTGSIVGLVTFGDEVVGFSRVLADQEAVQAPEWEVDSDHVPAVGSPVTLILRRFSSRSEDGQ